MKRIYIRADGNQEIAMGHIMRCLAIADACKKQGAQVIFVCAGEEAAQVIRDRGFALEVLGSDPHHMEEELPALGALLSRQPADLLLVDSYLVTDKYMTKLSEMIPLAYIDDLGEAVYPLSLLIGYEGYSVRLPYKEHYQAAGLPLPRLLLGLPYVPLRNAYAEGLRAPIRPKVQDVLISTGGGDLLGIAGALAAKLREQVLAGQHPGICYHFLCGPFSRSRESLRQMEGEPWIKVHEWLAEPWLLQQSCDLALSAAGSTVYELCAMALPTVLFYFAKNQRQLAEELAAEGLPCAGNLAGRPSQGAMADGTEGISEDGLNKLLTLLSDLEKDQERRRALGLRMQRLVDGCGADRIARAMLSDLG